MAADTETGFIEKQNALAFWRFVTWANKNKGFLAILVGVCGTWGGGLFQGRGKLNAKVDSVLTIAVKQDARLSRVERKVDTTLFKAREAVGAIERIKGGKAALSGYRRDREDFRHRQEIYGPEMENGAKLPDTLKDSFALQRPQKRTF